MLMGRVRGNIITAFTDIEFPMPIGVIAHSTDTTTVERRPLAKQAAGVELLTSAVAPTAIWRNYALDGSLDVFLVEKLYARLRDFSLAFNPDVIWAVDHNLGYVRVPKQLPYGAESEQVASNQFCCLVLDGFALSGKGRGAAYVIQRSILDGCLIDKGVLDLLVVSTVSHDFCYSGGVFSLKHGYSSD